MYMNTTQTRIRQPRVVGVDHKNGQARKLAELFCPSPFQDAANWARKRARGQENAAEPWAGLGPARHALGNIPPAYLGIYRRQSSMYTSGKSYWPGIHCVRQKLQHTDHKYL